METVNPKNFIDIDPYTVSFITLKDGNMIMIDELTPAKPNKVKIILYEEKNNLESKNKEKWKVLSLSKQINFSFISNQSIIIKKDFNLISKITKNISFSFLKKNINSFKNSNNNEYITNNNQNNIFNNFTNLNTSIDLKKSIIQNRKYDYMNINNINNNILSDDNVNTHLTDNIMSPIINNRKKSDEAISNKNNNLRQINKVIKDTQKYTFDENANKENDNGNIFDIENFQTNSYNNMKIEYINKNHKEIINNNSINQINFNNRNGNLNNLKYINNQNDNFEQFSYNKNNPSLVIQNTNFYNQNEFQKNYMNSQNKNNKTEIIMNSAPKENINTSIRYKRLNRLRQNKKDNNYVKAVVSINIPAEEEENIDLEKQFNSLVDRLNGQKSKTKAKEIIKRSERYYELYKNTNENIFTSFISPEKNKKKYKKNNFFDINNYFTNKIRNKKKYEDINKINSKEINNSKINNLNNRIMTLKEKSFTSMNNSFINDKKNNNFSEIVFPSNFS